MRKLKVINGNGKYKDEDSRVDVINYILRKDRAIHGHWGGSHIDLQFPIAAMEAHADSWNKNSGVRIRHFVLSFSHEEVSSPEFAKKRLGSFWRIIWDTSTRRFLLSTRIRTTFTFTS